MATGLSPEEKLHGVKYIIESFVGCIKEMVLSAGKAASDLLPIKPLIATKHDNVQEGCIDKYDLFYYTRSSKGTRKFEHSQKNVFSSCIIKNKK